jgi:alpha-L-rhamnosidase
MEWMTSPGRLGVEHLGSAVLGIGERRPRLSWQLPDGASLQTAWCVQVNGRDLGAVDGDAHVLVSWPDDPLTSRQHVQWRVKVWTDLGESGWSAPAWFETGLLHRDDWIAEWIEPREPERAPAGSRPAHVLQRTFTLDATPASARLYATAHGCYEAFLNGRRVGEIELAPGFTSYWARLDVQTYDVTDLLEPGENVWQVVLSDGWYRGRTGFAQTADCYGDRLAFVGQLHAGDTVVTSDRGWRSATGPILAADLMATVPRLVSARGRAASRAHAPGGRRARR